MQCIAIYLFYISELLYCRQEDILKSLLDNLFRLMPIEVLHHAESKKLYHPEWFSSRVEFVAESKINEIAY